MKDFGPRGRRKFDIIGIRLFISDRGNILIKAMSTHKLLLIAISAALLMACCISEKETVKKTPQSAYDELMGLLSGPPLKEYVVEQRSSGSTMCASWAARNTYRIRDETTVYIEISSDHGDCTGNSHVSRYTYDASNDTRTCEEKSKKSGEQNYTIKNYSSEECNKTLSDQMAMVPFASIEGKTIMEAISYMKDYYPEGISSVKVDLPDGRVCYSFSGKGYMPESIIACFSAEKHLLNYKRIYQGGPPATETWDVKGYELAERDWALIDEALNAEKEKNG